MDAFLKAIGDNSGAIAAISTATLSILTGVYVILTFRQAKHLRSQVEEMAKQSKIMQEQAERARVVDRRRVRQAAQALVTEIQVNVRCGEFTNRAPFSSDGFSTYLRLSDEIPMHAETGAAIAIAYLSIGRFNVEFVGDASGRTNVGASDNAWAWAKRDIANAKIAIESDSVFQEFLNS